jgi:ABC-type branched-subunit amino acid transport system substrate-binding protein
MLDEINFKSFPKVVSLLLNTRTLSLITAKSLEGSFIPTSYFLGSSRQENIDFKKKYELTFLKNAKITVDMFHAYNNINFWINAVNKSLSFETNKIKDVLKNAVFSSPSGILSFDASLPYCWLPEKLFVIDSNKNTKLFLELPRNIPPFNNFEWAEDKEFLLKEAKTILIDSEEKNDQ